MPLRPAERAEQSLVIMGCGGGLQVDRPYVFVKPSEAILLQDCTVRVGVVEKALGCAQLGDQIGGSPTNYGLFQFKRMDAAGAITRQELSIWATTLYERVGANWTNRGTVSGSRHATAVQYGNRLFISNGSADPLVWDGTTLQEVNCAVPPTPSANADPEDIDADGVLVTGDIISIGAIYYDPVNGDVSNASDIFVYREDTGGFIGAGGDNVIKIDIAAQGGLPARFTKVRLYRSRPGISDLLYESEIDFDTPGDNTTAITDATIGAVADTALGALLEYDNQDMPKYQILWAYDDRIFGTYDPDNQTEVGWSKNDSRPTAWPLSSNRMELDKQDGFPVTGLREYAGRLYAFKKYKAYLISGDPQAQYSNKPLPASLGLVCHWACDIAKNYLWGLGIGSLWRFDGSGFEIVSKNRFASLLVPAQTKAAADPVYLVHDPNEERGELLIGLSVQDAPTGTGYMYNIDMNGLTEVRHLNRRLAVFERSDGVPWIVGGVDDGTAEEFFVNSGDVPYTTKVGIAFSQEFRTGAIDPDPKIGHKVFIRVDFMFRVPTTGQPDDTWTYGVYYDENIAGATETGTVGPFGAATKETTIFPVRLKGEIRKSISLSLASSVANKYAFRLAGIRIVWKPAGDIFAL